MYVSETKYFTLILALIMPMNSGLVNSGKRLCKINAKIKCKEISNSRCKNVDRQMCNLVAAF